MTFEKLIRPEIISMKAYTPILPFEVVSAELGRDPSELIKLDANENPYGPSPKVLEAIAGLDETIHIYPDPESRHLRAMLADYAGIGVEHLLMGAGADELIDLIMRLFIATGDGIINCPPTFGMYSFDGALNAAKMITVGRGEDFSLDIVGIEAAVKEHQAKLVFICSPNNPNGGVIAEDDLVRLLALPAIIILDEAYIEFADCESAIKRVSDNPNLIVLRTFSKWAGLAGLRIGWGAFPLWMMEQLWKIKQPYSINVAADAAARASLADLDTLLDRVAQIKAERDRLYEMLASLSFLNVYPSEGNFLLCQVVGGEDAYALKQGLAAEGILIRYFNKPGLDDHIRISVGRPEQSDRVLDVLKKMIESGEMES